MDPYCRQVMLRCSLSGRGHTLCPVTAILTYLAIRQPTDGWPLYLFPDGTQLSYQILMVTVQQILINSGPDIIKALS